MRARWWYRVARNNLRIARRWLRDAHYADSHSDECEGFYASNALIARYCAFSCIVEALIARDEARLERAWGGSAT